MIREYQTSDFERVKQMYERQGFSFPFPDLSDPVFAVSSVVEENGEAQVAAFLKIHAEAYLFLDPEYATPRQRWETLLQVHEDVRQKAADLGLAGVTCWVPPNLPKSFARRLQKLGWGKDEWQAYSYRIRKSDL